MYAVLELASRCGIAIEYADLGEWGVDQLRSEYDPDGPVIRINTRVIEGLPVAEIGRFIAFCVAHELYHHREHVGEIPQLRDRRAREAAADDFARRMLA
jgi:Zn-dependent peptidase ImmA (M78 family)